MAPQIVKLNVGGVFYDTSLQTLSVEGSYFAALLSGNWNDEKDENGRIFIDRDGKAFEYVLDFLRNGSNVVFPESLVMRRRVHREADYYILPKLAALLMNYDIVELNVGGIHYTTTRKTLLVEDSYFEDLFSCDLYSRKDGNGRIVIDRDGEAFKYVLNFLQNGERMVFPENSEMQYRICIEACFYKLSDLLALYDKRFGGDLSFMLEYYDESNIVGKRYILCMINLSLARIKSYPNCWFDKTFSSGKRSYTHFERERKLCIALAIVAEYVGSRFEDEHVIRVVDSVQMNDVVKAVDFFILPRVVADEIAQRYGKVVH